MQPLAIRLYPKGNIGAQDRHDRPDPAAMRDRAPAKKVLPNTSGPIMGSAKSATGGIASADQRQQSPPRGISMTGARAFMNIVP